MLQLTRCVSEVEVETGSADRCPIIGSPPPPEKSPPADDLPAKIRPTAAARAGRISTGKLSAGGDSSGGGDDPIMGRLFMLPAIF